MDIAQANDLFAKHLESIGKSDSTIKITKACLKAFDKCRHFEDINLITKEAIKDFSDYLKKTVKVPTVNNYMSQLKSFFRSMYELNYMAENLESYCTQMSMEEAKLLKGPLQLDQKPGRFMEEKEREDILRMALLTDSSMRNPLLLETALVCGISIEEIICLKTGNFDFITGYLAIDGKGVKARSFYVGNNEYLERMEKYIDDQDLKDPDQYVFQTIKGKQMTRSSFRSMFERVVRLAGYQIGRNGGFTLHDLKRTSITYTLSKGLSIIDMMDIAGQACVETTLRYMTKEEK